MTRMAMSWGRLWSRMLGHVVILPPFTNASMTTKMSVQATIVQTTTRTIEYLRTRFDT
jgi:hypothetical protein